MLSSQNMKILINIIGAVESGGQVYGNRRYDAYAAPYTNTPKEYTITLGWAQNYGAEAYKLISLIYAKDPASFKKIDASGVIQARINGEHDWVAERWNPTASQKAILIKLIDSPAGHTCQDELFAELMEAFVKSCEQDYTKDAKAIMMYCEIRHLGGKSAADRIFKRCGSNFSLDNIMAALKKDQSDTSSSNQVGDKVFQSRHDCCYKWIKQYVIDNTSSQKVEETIVKDTKTMTMDQAIQAAINVASAEIGYLEKASNKNLDSKTGNAGYNNYTKYWRDIKPSYQGAQWCLAFTMWILWKTFGKEKAMQLVHASSSQFPWTYCPDLGDIGTRYGQLHSSPKAGDIVLFWKNRGSEGGWRFGHAEFVISVGSSTFTTIGGNTSSGSNVVPNGGGVYKKTYNFSDMHSRTRYYRPDYSIVGSVVNGGGSAATPAAPSSNPNTTTKKSSSGSPSTTQKWIGEVTASSLNVRTGPGTSYPKSSYYPVLTKGNRVGVCDEVINSNGEKWYFIVIKNDVVKARKKTSDTIYDYVSAKYIKKV